MTARNERVSESSTSTLLGWYAPTWINFDRRIINFLSSTPMNLLSLK